MSRVRALDELRFGSHRTLNLRESLPSAAEAARRADSWLREQQVKGSKEVLVITGRGNHSFGGVPVLKPAIEKLLHSLRRQGVVSSHQEHNPGAFVVTLAPLRSLAEAAPRHRDQHRTHANFDFAGIGPDTTTLLRELAELSLEALGITPDESRIRDEMYRHLRVLAPGLPSGPTMEGQLRAALRTAIREYD